MPGTKDLRDKLEEWGYHTTARTTRKIARVRRVGNIITFEIPDALAYNQMKNDKEVIEKALTEIMRKPTKARLVRDLDDDFSPEMRQLQKFFGGTLIHTDRNY